MKLSKREKKHLKRLLQKYEAGVATPEQQRFVDTYFDSLDLINSDVKTWESEDLDAVENEKEAMRLRTIALLSTGNISVDKVKPLYRTKVMRYVVAAAVLLFAGIGLYLLLNFQNDDYLKTALHNRHLILPGHSGAILTLSDGTNVVLDSAENKQISLHGGASVINYNGELHYSRRGHDVSETIYNTLSTPKARQYNLVLADGTKVWLNASSSLVYPITFSGRERKVVLKGEAYFMVVHDSTRPFKVQVAGQEIIDVGTSFNVSAYEDAQGMEATLVEGAIKINGHELIPGQAAIVGEDGHMSVKRVNVEAAIAWKNGKFVFEREDIKDVMRKLSRWYDVDVVYHGQLPPVTFTGSISRFDDISLILRKITYTSGIHFHLKERRIIVSE